MRINRKAVLAIGISIMLVLASFLLPSTRVTSKVTTSFPATACPNLNTASIAVLNKKDIKVRSIGSKSTNFKSANSTTVSVQSAPLLVAGNSANTLIFANATWKAVTTCSISDGDEWFLGGSGSLTSKSQLIVVNSGLSNSIIDVSVFSANGLAGKNNYTIPPNSQLVVGLDSLAPGQENLTTHVQTRAGRISSFVFDQRNRGLKLLGADYVPPITTAQNTVYIPAISDLTGKLNTSANLASHTLRLFVPGTIDANIDVEVNTADGSFVPLGFSQRTITQQRTIDLPFTFATANKPFAVKVTSDQPIFASVFSQFKYGNNFEIAWSGMAEELKEFSANLAGSIPTFNFAGELIDVQINYSLSNGKKGTQSLSAQNFATWTAPSGVNQFQVFSKRSDTYGGLIILPESAAAGIGSTYIPFNNGSKLETTSEPVIDARVISRG